MKITIEDNVVLNPPAPSEGADLPTGGTTGQVLGKASNDDGDVEWIDQASGGNAEVNLWAGKKWSALGTSITADGSYVDQLVTLSSLVVTNLGFSGGTLSTSAKNGAGGEIFNDIPLIPSDTNLVTLEGCINDFRTNAVLGALGDTTQATFYGAVYKALQLIIAQNQARTIIIITSYGNSDTNFTGNYIHANDIGLHLWQYNNALKEVAAMVGIPIIDVGEYSGIGGLTSTQYFADGIHLNTNGAVRYAQFVWSKLKNMYFSATGGSTSQTATPQTSPMAGFFSSGQDIELYSATAGSTIHYTTDGSTPTTSSPVYTTAIHLTATTTIKALATHSGLTDSGIFSGTYTISSAKSFNNMTHIPTASALTAASKGLTVSSVDGSGNPTQTITGAQGAIQALTDSTYNAAMFQWHNLSSLYEFWPVMAVGSVGGETIGSGTSGVNAGFSLCGGFTPDSGYTVAQTTAQVPNNSVSYPGNNVATWGRMALDGNHFIMEFSTDNKSTWTRLIDLDITTLNLPSTYYGNAGVCGLYINAGYLHAVNITQGFYS